MTIQLLLENLVLVLTDYSEEKERRGGHTFTIQAYKSRSTLESRTLGATHEQQQKKKIFQFLLRTTIEPKTVKHHLHGSNLTLIPTLTPITVLLHGTKHQPVESALFRPHWPHSLTSPCHVSNSADQRNGANDDLLTTILIWMVLFNRKEMLLLKTKANRTTHTCWSLK